MPIIKKKRGRKPGPGIKFGPTTNSYSEWLSTFIPGERRYVGTALDTHQYDMTQISRSAARHESLKGNFTQSFFTAVPTTAGGVRYLICVERVK